MNTNHTSEPMMLDSTDMALVLRLSKKGFYNFLKSPLGETFPKPVKLGPRLIRWRRLDVEEWVDGLMVEKEKTAE